MQGTERFPHHAQLSDSSLTVSQMHKFWVNSGFQNFALPHFSIIFTNRKNSTPVMLRDNLLQKQNFQEKRKPSRKTDQVYPQHAQTWWQWHDTAFQQLSFPINKKRKKKPYSLYWVWRSTLKIEDYIHFFFKVKLSYKAHWEGTV